MSQSLCLDAAVWLDRMGEIVNYLKSALASVAVFALASTSTPAAAVVTLNFENINSTYPSGFAQILQFYNGGLSSNGTTGTNYGISFGSNAQALCLNSMTTSCSSTSRGGLGDPGSQQGGLFFLSGSETFLNYAAGFDTGFSFNYVGSFTGSVQVYDGLDGTGNVLGSVSLISNLGSCPGYNADFCPFGPAGVNFSGTARSISFGGVANQIAFDDVTFGSSTPGVPALPEPATWAMMLVGFGGMGVALRRRRKTATIAQLA